MSKNTKLITILLLLCGILTIAPFIFSAEEDFTGADDRAGQVVEEITPGYQPWISPIVEQVLGKELPGETESLLFCIQSAIGSGILCFCFGYLVARKKYQNNIRENNHEDSV